MNNTSPTLRVIVYWDGSIEANANHAALVSRFEARYASHQEIASYERSFARDDARICQWCGESPADCTLNECPAR